MRMTGNAKNRIFTITAVFLAVIMLCGCGAAGAEAAPVEADAEAVSETEETAAVTEDVTDSAAEDVTEVAEAEETYDVAEAAAPVQTPAAAADTFLDSVYSADEADGEEDVYIDLSHADEGYFGVHSDSDTRIKIQVVKDDEQYIYDPVTGEDDIYPFQCGDGEYSIRVMKNVEGSKYYELFAKQADVKLKTEFEPFLRPSQYSDYSRDSACVQKASSFAAASTGKMDFISKVYDFVCSTVTYDDEKAETVKSGYMPDPDETMATGKGICFDYAALTAAMLRSQGVPTKLIFGYVGKNELYHAWNMFYTEEEGWITVEFKAVPGDWNRVDLTFYANGADSQFIGDGSNYVDIYQY